MGFIEYIEAFQEGFKPYQDEIERLKAHAAQTEAILRRDLENERAARREYQQEADRLRTALAVERAAREAAEKERDNYRAAADAIAKLLAAEQARPAPAAGPGGGELMDCLGCREVGLTAKYVELTSGLTVPSCPRCGNQGVVPHCASPPPQSAADPGGGDDGAADCRRRDVMNELAKRLRSRAERIEQGNDRWPTDTPRLLNETADEVGRLQAELAAERQKRESAEKDRDKALIHLGRLAKETRQAHPAPAAALGSSDGPCSLCGELTDSLAADPNRWPLIFTDPGSHGRATPHHVGCVRSRCFPPRPAAKRREELGRLVQQAFLSWLQTQDDYDPAELEVYAWERMSEEHRESACQLGDAVAAALGPARPAAIVRVCDSEDHWHGFEKHEDANLLFSQPDILASQWSFWEIRDWTWHPATPAPAAGEPEGQP